jgi:hypothetical protein
MISEGAAKLALATAGIFLAMVALLHVIESEYGPMWRFLSEYSNGDVGWLMRLAFFTLASSCAALAVAVHSQVGTRSGKVGLVLLGLAVVGMVLAGLFNQDPITSKETTTTGNLHGMSSVLGIPGFTIGTLLTGLSLARNPAWADICRPLIWLSNVAWVSLVAMLGYMAAAVPMAGGFGPNVWVGLFNRILVAAWCAWLIYVAWHALKVRSRGNAPDASLSRPSAPL